MWYQPTIPTRIRVRVRFRVRVSMWIVCYLGAQTAARFGIVDLRNGGAESYSYEKC